MSVTGRNQAEAVAVRELVVRYGKVEALRGVTLDMEWQTAVALLGPNGAGKTTLLRVLTTLLPRFTGSALVDGHDVRRAAADVRRVIGLMPQESNLYEELTAWENMKIQGGLYGMPASVVKDRAGRLLERMGLTTVANRPVSTYSGGMKRRLVYARTLLHDPPIVFLDEPTTGLDVQARAVLWEDIGGLLSSGRCVVLTTHYIEEAERLCRRVVVLDHGRVIADGSPDQLKIAGEETLEEVILNLTGRELRLG
ncbi:MAG TPA: multidrug ABC transporter ATP-binding protein [Clostridiales bacterium]|nr:multidrug ABC transporter ATP-binding protein [Clostridiales bacterium]